MEREKTVNQKDYGGKYYSPEIHVVNFEDVDVIRTSGNWQDAPDWKQFNSDESGVL